LDEDPWPWGSEPIYRNGKYCGSTTSTAYGFTLDRHVCLGYVQDLDNDTGEPKVITNDFILKNATFEVDIAGKRFPAKAGIYPPKLASAAIVINPMQGAK
jgi:pyruvate dehydrogenase phosphatase regulatory subunit